MQMIEQAERARLAAMSPEEREREILEKSPDSAEAKLIRMRRAWAEEGVVGAYVNRGKSRAARRAEAARKRKVRT
jgi:hypothetical protein